MACAISQETFLVTTFDQVRSTTSPSWGSAMRTDTNASSGSVGRGRRPLRPAALTWYGFLAISGSSPGAGRLATTPISYGLGEPHSLTPERIVGRSPRA